MKAIHENLEGPMEIQEDMALYGMVTCGATLCSDRRLILQGTTAGDLKVQKGARANCRRADGGRVELGITPQTVFKWLKKGQLQGRQLTKEQPWQIDLTQSQIRQFRVTTPRITQSRMKAS